MRRKKPVRGWSARPQLLAMLVAMGLLLGGATQTLRDPAGPSEPPLISVQSKPYEPVVGPPKTDCARAACLVLSFDDGPDAVVTPHVLDILAQYHARADFFVVGTRAAAMPGLLQRMHREGHEVGNHSWGHPDFTTLTPEQIQFEINQTQAAVIAAGLPAPHLFRPPYGAVNAMVLSRIPMAVALWNVDPEDWHSTDPNYLAARVVTTAKPGGVVAMHDLDPTTAQALPAILQNLQSRFQLVTMSELLDLSPGQRGEFFGRWHP